MRLGLAYRAYSTLRTSRISVTRISPDTSSPSRFSCDIAGDLHAYFIIDLVRIDHHAHLAAGLDGVGLADAFEALGEFLEILQAFDVALQTLARAPGRLALMASAAITISVYGVVGGTSP